MQRHNNINEHAYDGESKDPLNHVYGIVWIWILRWHSFWMFFFNNVFCDNVFVVVLSLLNGVN